MIVGIFTVVFILLFSLQTSLMSYFSVGGVTLDLALILAVYCGVLLKGDRGIWVGFAIGLIQDCLSGSLLGVNTLSKSIIGFTFSTLKDKLMVIGFVPISVILFAASFFDGLVYYLISDHTSQGPNSISVFYSARSRFTPCTMHWSDRFCSFL